MRVSIGRKASVAGPQKEGRHTVSKFRRAVSMKIAIKDRKSCNITAELERRKAASKSGAVNESKSF